MISAIQRKWMYLPVPLKLIRGPLFATDVPADNGLVTATGEEKLIDAVPFQTSHQRRVTLQGGYRPEWIILELNHLNLPIHIANKGVARLVIKSDV